MLKIEKNIDGKVVINKIEQGQKFVDIARIFPMHRVFAKTPFSTMPTSVIDKPSCHIYYDEAGTIREIEFFPESELVLSGLQIFQIPQKEITEIENIVKNNDESTIKILDTEVLLKFGKIKYESDDFLDSVIISF